tara:strand:+ start:433 stop:786 length:354 start_codon:yes stop_codon:yes gene_type:complete
MHRVLVTIAALIILVGPAVVQADDRDDARAQVDFGIEVAMRDLWNEAIFRFERAIQIDPTYAEAWNNLAIAFENMGRLEDALEAYETALDLDPQNIQIETNYDLFLEVSDRVNQSNP